MEYLYSFAQDNEDIILWHGLRNYVADNEIFWVDVGANDPIDISVTKFFSLRGGHGINIEPQPQYAESYRIDRPNDINLTCGISNEMGELELFGTGVLASMEYNPDKKSEGITVPVKTLTQICDQYLERNQEIHFLKIDVEGYETQALEGMDFSKYTPWLICIESTDHRSKKNTYFKWENILISGGYIFVCQFGINRYYVASSHKEIAHQFDDISNLSKFYSIAKHDLVRRYQELYSEYNSMKSSRSWRITEPFRSFLRKVRGT